MPLSRFERRLREYRADLLQHDGQVRQSLAAAYQDAKVQMQRDVKAAAVQLAEMPADPMFDRRGRFTDRGQVQWRHDRLIALQRQIDDQLVTLANQADQLITAGQRTTARLGAQQALGLVEAQVPGLAASFNVLPTAAIENIVGMLSDNSPLRSLLNQQGLAAGDEARRILTNAVAIGTGPREVARELARVLNRSQWRAEQTARNALLDSHRLASIRTYQQAPDVCRAWAWTCAYSARTCLSCLGLANREFPLTEEFMPRHSACRCSPRVVLHDRFGPMPELESGEEWLDRQSVETQRKMIPVALWDEYRVGAVRLDDFVAEDYSSRWGRSFRQATIPEARASAAGRERVAA